MRERELAFDAIADNGASFEPTALLGTRISTPRGNAITRFSGLHA